jgi:hypothetical protein
MSTVEEECKHGLTMATCYVCRHPSVPRPAVQPLRVIAYLAQSHYGGQCPECDLPIYQGSPIAKLTDGTREFWVHDACAPRT